MKGLRSQESERFNAYFSLIQAQAEKQGMVFFADAGDGRDFETETMEGEDMMGWLIPQEKADEFTPLWQASAVNDAWTDYFLWAVWVKNGDEIGVRFEHYGDEE